MTNIGIFYNIECNQYITKIINQKKQMSSITVSKGLKNYILNLIKITENDKIGKLFEENIRKTIEIELGWKISNIPRFFFFRKLQDINSTNILFSDSVINYSLKGKKVLTFKFNSDTKACEVKNHKTKEKKKFNQNKDNIIFTEFNLTFIISPVDRIEVDGIYDVNNFLLPKFDPHEVSIIYNNINDEFFRDNKLITVILEVKLSKGKLPELIKQINRDNTIMKHIIENKMIYIGFVGKGEKDEVVNSDLKINIENLKCIIYEVKQDQIFERNLRHYINWSCVKDLKKMNVKIDTLINKIDGLIGKVNELENDYNKFKVDIINFKNDVWKYLGKKRKI